MPGKDVIRSARKKFMVMRTKSQIFALMESADSEVDEKLSELHGGLAKVFGEKDATDILESAIEAADGQFSDSIKQVIVDSVQDEVAGK